MAYLTFLSNYNKDIYDWNTPAAFCNSLAEPLTLDEGASYEISLAELSYNNNHIIKADDITLKVFDWFHLNKDGTYGTMIHLQLSHSIINNAIDLVNVINSLIWGVIPRFNEKKYKFFTFENNRRIWANMEENMYLTIILEARLLIMMGITNRDSKRSVIILGDTKKGDFYMYDGKKRVFAPDIIDMISVSHKKDFFRLLPKIPISEEILLYTDLVKSNHVANNMINLLKMLPLKKNRDLTTESERVVVSYGSDRIYRPLVSKNCIKEANFALKSLSGDPIELEGYLRVLVHIRRIGSSIS